MKPGEKGEFTGARNHAPDDVWAAVDALIDRAPSLDDLREHRLQLLAERRWLLAGKPIPERLVAEKTLAAALDLPVPSLLARIAAAWQGTKVIMKGPELASRYPDGLLRAAGDVDLLVEDAGGAHAALCGAGFVVTGDPRRYVEIHHLQPLIWPGIPVRIEFHHAPKWVDGLEPPSTAELLALSIPSRAGVEGFLTLTPAAHLVVLAVHAWAHEPLGSLRDLIDIAVIMPEADEEEIEELARRWGVSRIWRTTHAAAAALFAGGRPPIAMHLWARHLEAARGRTVAESHLERWISPYWALPPRTALTRTVRRIAEETRPVPGELWRTKLSRARLAVRNAGVRRSSHQRLLEESRLATPPELFLDRVERRRGDRRTGEGSE
jgi:hypothetical protein